MAIYQIRNYANPFTSHGAFPNEAMAPDVRWQGASLKAGQTALREARLEAPDEHWILVNAVRITTPRYGWYLHSVPQGEDAFHVEICHTLERLRTAHPTQGLQVCPHGQFFLGPAPQCVSQSYRVFDLGGKACLLTARQAGRLLRERQTGRKEGVAPLIDAVCKAHRLGVLRVDGIFLIWEDDPLARYVREIPLTATIAGR